MYIHQGLPHNFLLLQIQYPQVIGAINWICSEQCPCMSQVFTGSVPDNQST